MDLVESVVSLYLWHAEIMDYVLFPSDFTDMNIKSQKWSNPLGWFSKGEEALHQETDVILRLIAFLKWRLLLHTYFWLSIQPFTCNYNLQ